MLLVLFLPYSIRATVNATMGLNPVHPLVNVNQTFPVTINIDTAGEPIDGADVASLHFNPASLQVVSITPGTLMPNTVANSFDNTLGKVQFSQVTAGGTSFTGTGVLATINFKALTSGSSNITIDFTLGATNDSNLAAVGVDRLGSVTNATVGVLYLGDINKDGIVNSLDWSLMNAKWFTNDANADLNKDGIVNSLDWSIMNSNWLKTI